MIRRGNPVDAPDVARIFRESRAEAMPWLPVLHSLDEDLAWFGRALAGESYVFCASASRMTQGTGLAEATPSSPAFEEEGQILGFAIVREDDLDALYVAPAAQRHGVGSALFRRAQEARPDGLSWWVFRDNERARRFYESLGGRLLYETDGRDNEERTPDARYEWRPER